MSRQPTVALRRGYSVLTVEDANAVASAHLAGWKSAGALVFGLAEIDDRYHVWRVPLLSRESGEKVGEVVVEAFGGAVDERRGSDEDAVTARLPAVAANGPRAAPARESVSVSPLGNTILCGDSEVTLRELPDESVDLVFTSPPYYNARPDYGEFAGYEAYLDKIGRVMAQCHRTLHEGRFFVMNVAPVLIRRSKRSESSRRLAVPFDMHRLLVESGFDFVDDIVWVKPEGAGWATGRGRRFAADRNPLQYKAVPVTEYLLVYRKRTDRLIDWHIRTHPDPAVVERSKIRGEYERTNVWKIKPAHSKAHPAVFPVELAERVIRYYSFERDVVLDPFAGIGTVGEAAAALGRRWVLSELDPGYVDVIRSRAANWTSVAAAEEGPGG